MRSRRIGADAQANVTLSERNAFRIRSGPEGWTWIFLRFVRLCRWSRTDAAAGPWR